MPKYYHIHRGLSHIDLENNFIKNSPLFFSRKNSEWYNMEKTISIEYGGYIEYEIYIPSSSFTTSFNPRSKNKILKINKENMNDYLALRKDNTVSAIIAKINKNIIGIDATMPSLIDHKNITRGPPEGFIWIKPRCVKITIVRPMTSDHNRRFKGNILLYT